MPFTYTPLRYPGGKSQFYKQVANILNSNNIVNATYVEPFAGGAGVGLKLLMNNLVNDIIINDLDKAIYAFWYTVIHHNKWMLKKINETEVSIEEWKKQRLIYLQSNDYSLKELGFATLFLNRCNRSGILYAGPIGGKNQSGKYKIDCRFNKKNISALIEKIGHYKKKIKVFNYDASKLIIKLKNQSNLFWFIDPPYFVKGEELYNNSFDYDDHKSLSKIIKEHLSKQTWILTYDFHKEIYDLYSDFDNEIITLTYCVGGRKKENEYLFFNGLTISKEMLLRE